MAAELVSIALCTYNGQVYIKEQLDSLIDQTYPNCEIIIVDDCSKDGTVDILKQYSNTYSQIKLYINNENIGYTKNFEKAINLCNGEYIALCDQDDIWDKNKISIIVDRIGDNILIYHDSAFVDEMGAPMNKKVSDIQNCYSGSDPRIFLFGNCVLGHAMLFKRELLHFMGNFNDIIIHDRWLGYVATNTGSIVYLDQPLIQYRQHRNANTNILKQERNNKSKSSSIYKMQFQLDVVTIFANYPFNTQPAFMEKMRDLMQDRMQSYTSFSLAYFIFKNRDVVFYIFKKSALSKFNLALKYIWGYEIKKLSLFNKET